MKPEVERARTPAERERAGRRAAEVLAAGGIVVHPTETVYGLGGDGSPETNRWIAGLKGRPPSQPLLLLTPDLDTLRRRLPGIGWPQAAEELARRFWPGPLTLILPCASAPEGLAGPDGGVGVRVSPHPVIAAIFRHWKQPMTSTSANRTRQSPARTLPAALELFEDVPEEAVGRTLALDAGRTSGDPPSTIVSLTRAVPRLLRAGPIPGAEIREVVPDLESE